MIEGRKYTSPAGDIFVFDFTQDCLRAAVSRVDFTNGSLAADVHSIRIEKDGVLVKRWIASGNAEGSFILCRAPYYILLENGIHFSEAEAYLENSHQLKWEACFLEKPAQVLQAVSRRCICTDENDIFGADRLVAVGRGAGSREMLQKAELFAKKSGMSFGVTRQVVSMGWASWNRQIGISGAVTSAEKTLVLGASGSPAFLSGIRKSKKILAVNVDPEAPIFKHCDEYIIGDIKEIIPILEKEIGAE